MNPDVELHIRELVLHGFEPGDSRPIGEAVERELARRFDEQGVPRSLAQGSKIERIDGGVLEVTRDSKAEAIGVRVARAVYGGLTG